MKFKNFFFAYLIFISLNCSELEQKSSLEGYRIQIHCKKKYLKFNCCYCRPKLAEENENLECTIKMDNPTVLDIKTAFIWENMNHHILKDVSSLTFSMNFYEKFDMEVKLDDTYRFEVIPPAELYLVISEID